MAVQVTWSKGLGAQSGGRRSVLVTVTDCPGPSAGIAVNEAPPTSQPLLSLMLATTVRVAVLGLVTV